MKERLPSLVRVRERRGQRHGDTQTGKESLQNPLMQGKKPRGIHVIDRRAHAKHDWFAFFLDFPSSFLGSKIPSLSSVARRRKRESSKEGHGRIPRSRRSLLRTWTWLPPRDRYQSRWKTHEPLSLFLSLCLRCLRDVPSTYLSLEECARFDTKERKVDEDQPIVYPSGPFSCSIPRTVSRV